MGRLGGVVRFAAIVLREVQASGMKYPAAAIAYYTFVATLPLLLLVFVVLGEQIAGEITTITPEFLTPEARRLISDSLTTAAGRTGASLLATVVFVWSAVNVVTGFLDGLARIEGTRSERTRFRQAVNGVIVLAAFGLGIAAIVLASALPSLYPAVPFISVVSVAGLPVVLTFVFLPLYVVPARTVRTVRSAVPGAIVAAVGWTLLQTVLRVYAASAGRYALYGVLSGIILLLTSLYLGALALMIGAAVNELLSNDAGRA